MKTDHYRGPVSKGVTVTTNDPATPNVYLTIKANIVGSVVLLPNAVIGLNASRAEKKGGRLLVRKDESEQGRLEVVDAKASVPWLLVTTRRLDGTEGSIEGIPQPASGDWLLEVSAADGVAPGNYNEKVTFRTGLTREPEVTVPVNVFVRAAVSVNPNEIMLRSPGPAGTTVPEGIALVVVRADVDPATVAVETDPPSMKARLEPSGSRAFRLHVSWGDPSPPGPISGSVSISGGGETAVLRVRLAPPDPPPATR